jgi:hypothetical protein
MPFIHSRRRLRPGVILLESLLALALLASAVVAILAYTSADQDYTLRLIDRSRDLENASAFLEVAALWTRDEYDQRLGTRPQGPYTLTITRPLATLYILELRDGRYGQILLSTAVYRAEDGRDEP